MRRFVLLLALTACGVEANEPDESEPDELEIDTSARGLIDCTEYQDTGYTSGNAFSITVVTVDGKPVERDTANAYWVMQQAAAQDGVNIAVVSGFRTMAQQEYLYGCYINCNCNNCNLAARPGYSNHQSGHALDLNASSSGVLNWLNNHGGAYGFSRTVPSENWHWEWWGGGPGGGPCGHCTPHCEGTEIVGDDCGRGDCAAYGARCVDDAIGVRCASNLCPDTGRTEVCVSDTLIGQCNDGAIETGDCSAYAAFCSTVTGTARCTSVFCVASQNDTPVAHDTCLPDGQRYHCNDEGGLAPAPCPEGQVCTGGTCKDAKASAPDADPTMPYDELDPRTELDPQVPAPDQGEARLHGNTVGGCGCDTRGGVDTPILDVLVFAGVILRPKRPRSRVART